MIRSVPAAEPTIGKIETDLFTQPPFRPNIRRYTL